MIKVLDKSVSELIAAGEVIEKPASVVKELIENSIDAGAKSITVEIKNGGISFLRITDDGSGIPHDECPTAFLRHATSKVSSDEDLLAVSTLGFRGEALASVAAVSRANLLTKTKDAELGTIYEIEGGIEVAYEKIGCPDGTTIIIRDLFFNTPARLKFLKKDISEGNYVQSVLDKAALINPHIAFRFIRDNKLVRVTPGDGKAYSSVFAVYGKNLAVSMISVDFSQNGISVTGMVSQPLFCKSNRAFQNFYVNSRYIKSLTCSVSLEEAYRNSMMTGKFPACVLNISMNPADVDANVHPAKTEVRFSNDRAIFSAVHLAVKNALLNQKQESAGRLCLHEGLTNEKQTIKPHRNLEIRQYDPNPEVSAHTETIAFGSNQVEYTVSTKQEPEPINVEFKYINPESLIKKEKIPVNQDVLVEKEQQQIRVLGELYSTYIVCEQGKDLVIIDKHAADERIRFNRLKSQLHAHSQLLIEPVEVRLDVETCGRLLAPEVTEELREIGVRLESAESAEIVRVTAFPTVLDEFTAEELISSVSELTNVGGTLRFECLGLVDEVLHRIACRSAIKAGDKSVSYDMEQLAEKVLSSNDSEALRYCPHGRPITVRFTKRELEKKFKRIL